MIFIDPGQRKLPEGMEIVTLTRLDNESIVLSVASRKRRVAVVRNSFTVKNDNKDARCCMMVRKGAIASRKLPQRRVTRRNFTLVLVH